jgi:4'-phosphopantetheinyl transferase EntD
VPPDDNRQRGGAATTLLEPSALSETLLVRFPMTRHSVRVRLVTPEMVERAVARRGVDGVLTPSERAVFAALPLEQRRRDWLAGRVAAKRVLRATYRRRGDIEPPYTAIEIQNDADGAPRLRLDGPPDLGARLDLSIAHSHGAAVAAVSDRFASGTVGVDVEVTTPLSIDLVRRVLRASEIDRLGDRSTIEPTPLEMWTAKEAAMKAARHLCRSLRDVELSWTPSRMMRARIVGDGLPAHAIRVRHRTAGPYTIALALCR